MQPHTHTCAQEDELKYLQKQDYGRVPTYLLERKIELAAQAEAEERMKEQALIPPGAWVRARACVWVCVRACVLCVWVWACVRVWGCVGASACA